MVDPSSIIKTWGEKQKLAPGIFVYKNVLKKDMDIINRLESVLNNSNNPHKWREATVGYGFKKPEYRDCVDFKYRAADLPRDDEPNRELKNIWTECYEALSNAVYDYCLEYNMHELQYWEVMNFVKYGAGQHFGEHTDHGYSYTATTSVVGYLNDDYTGGEIYFRLQDLKYKPEAGDVVIFPSNYIYPHTALPVENGIKYSLVTMLDYTDRGHVVPNPVTKKSSFLK
jgi:hypothetical protein